MKAVSFEIPTVTMSLHPVPCLGIGLHWAWVFNIMIGTGRLLDTAVADGDAPLAADFASMVFLGICSTLLATALSDLRGVKRERGKAIVLATALGVAATVSFYLALMNGSGLALRMASVGTGLVAGAFTGYLLRCWGFVYRDCCARSVAFDLSCGLVMALAGYGIVLCLDSLPVFVGVTALLAAGEGVLCWVATRALEAPNAAGAATRALEAPNAAGAAAKALGAPGAAGAARLRSRLSYANVALVLAIFGFADRILRELALNTFDVGGDAASLAASVIFSTACFAVLGALIGLVPAARALDRIRYSYSTLLVVGTAAALLFFMDLSDGLAYKIVCLVAYLLFEVHVWGYVVGMPQDGRIPANSVFGLGLLSLFLGQSLSALADGFASSLAKPLHLGTVTEPLLFMLALLVAAVLLATGASESKAGCGVEASVRPLVTEDEDRVRKVGAASLCFLLTEREGEVLSMLMRGRSFAKIGDALFLSENTVKTHVKNIYRKTGVHSKQELMDLVDGLG